MSDVSRGEGASVSEKSGCFQSCPTVHRGVKEVAVVQVIVTSAESMTQRSGDTRE